MNYPELTRCLKVALTDILDWLDDGNRVLSDSCLADVKKARVLLNTMVAPAEWPHSDGADLSWARHHAASGNLAESVKSLKKRHDYPGPVFVLLDEVLDMIDRTRHVPKERAKRALEMVDFISHLARIDNDEAIPKAREELQTYLEGTSALPLSHTKDRPDQGSSYIEGYGYVDTAAVRAIERVMREQS